MILWSIIQALQDYPEMTRIMLKPDDVRSLESGINSAKRQWDKTLNAKCSQKKRKL